MHLFAVAVYALEEVLPPSSEERRRVKTNNAWRDGACQHDVSGSLSSVTHSVGVTVGCVIHIWWSTVWIINFVLYTCIWYGLMWFVY